MNCPYKADQQHRWRKMTKGRSWESEPQKLVSLEAPDDEGEWCWPRWNRNTKWRMDARPTFHYLAEVLLRKSRRLED